MLQKTSCVPARGFLDLSILQPEHFQSQLLPIITDHLYSIVTKRRHVGGSRRLGVSKDDYTSYFPAKKEQREESDCHFERMAR